MDLLEVVESKQFDKNFVNTAVARIHAEVLATSHYLDHANFSTIHPDDLRLLFDRYDSIFFQGNIRDALGATSLNFSLSRRMTRSGGKTSCCTDGRSGRRYEISASTTLLFECFNGDDHRPITASSIACRDRLQALQRVMEHEIVHLVEMLLWNKSSCSRSRFQDIAQRFFGHITHKHNLITPVERAVVKFGIMPGTRVRFRFDGRVHDGVVNRISRRATVLVEDARGQCYSDGKHYAKYYVPMQALEVVK